MRHAFPCALFFGLAFGAWAQDASRLAQATPAQLEAARKEGIAEALADAKIGQFTLSYLSILAVIPEANRQWLGEWDGPMRKRGIRFPPSQCGSDFFDESKIVKADFECSLAKGEAYAEMMLQQIKARFGDDILMRLSEEAKALYEARDTPKPSTPKPASPKPKKRRS